MATLATAGFAQDFKDKEIDDLFTPGFKTLEEKFYVEKDRDELLLELNKSAQINCKNGLCKLHTVSQLTKGCNITFGIGEGDQLNNVNGGTVIDFNDSDSGNGNDEFWSAYLTCGIQHCSKTVWVLPETLAAVKVYLANLMNDDTTTKKGLTPADEAMIRLYTTIIDQMDCNTNNGNGGGFNGGGFGGGNRPF